MAILDNILKIFLPNYLAHAALESADRLKSQHCLGLVFALCTMV